MGEGVAEMRKGWRYVIAVIALLQPEERLKVMVDMRRFCKHCGRVGVENGEGVFWCKYDCSVWAVSMEAYLKSLGGRGA